MPEGDSTKRCGRCKEIKPLDCFGLVKGKVRSYCRPCHNACVNTPDLRTEKRCPRCKEVKPVSEFGKCGKRYHSYCLPCSREMSRITHEIDKKSGRSKARHREYYVSVKKWAKLRKKYGVERDVYEAMHESQDGLCAICREPETDQYMGTTLLLAVDHDHATGRVRGLLCRACNLAIGKFKENPEIVEAALNYLRRR